MKGLRELIDLRRDGLKPGAVWVTLTHSHDPYSALGHTGILTIEILPTDSLADIDFRPLKGLFVTVTDLTGNPERHRKVAALVGAIPTETLVMQDGDKLHIRRGETTETHTL